MKNSCRVWSLAAGIALVVLLAAPLLAQVERASLVGTIRDNSGAVVSDVEVKITHETTNVTVTVQTNQTGDFAVVDLIPGSYTVNAAHAGFSTRSYKGIVLQVAQTGRLDITLEVGAVEQTIEVTGAAPLMQTENSTVGQVISSDPINALPLNGRNFVQLAMMAPGVSGLDYAPSGGINSGQRDDEMRPGGTELQAAGATMMQNEVLIDGVDNSEIISGTFVVRPMIEGVQEFQVITNNAGAEFGRAGGATLVINTKSGGNDVHGSAYEFLRNTVFDAKNFFDRVGQANPPYKMNQFGASVGGPVVLPHYNGRDHTFFYMDYEGQREIYGLTYTSTVPTAAMRAGNFQGVVANGIFDPATTTLTGTTYNRTPFPNNQIPANRFDPIAAQLVNLYPLPQTTALANNYVSNPTKRSEVERADVRVDHQFSAKDTMFARYSIDLTYFTIPNTLNDAIGGNENSFAGPGDERGMNSVIADTHSFSPNMVGDFRFGYTRIDYSLTPSVLTDPAWGKIPGRDATDPYQPSAPIISPSGWYGLGDSRSLNAIRNEDNKDIIGNLTWQKGAHNLKFGGELRRRWVSETASTQGQSAFGRFNFSGAYTNNPASPSGTGYVGASMLLGLPTNIAREMFIAEVKNIYTWEPNFYFRDQWRIGRNLTLNLGVHYEVNTPFVEGNNNWGVFDSVQAKMLVAGQNGVNRYAGLKTDWGDIGPRVSFAYSAGPKTVIRGGFGRFFDPQEAQNNVRQSSQFPWDFIYTYTPGDIIPGPTVSQGFPTLAAEEATGIDLKNLNNLFGNLRAVALNFKNASYNEYNFGVQRRFTSTFALTVSYVGADGSHEAWTPGIDVPTPGPGAIQLRRPYNALYPNVSAISYLESAANSAYDSMQVSLEKRVSHGLYFIGNWTWGHSRDNASVMNPLNRRVEWGNAAADLRHQARINWTYALPFGPGQTFLNKSVAGKVVGGWELAGIAVLQSGVPFSVVTSSDPTNTGSGSPRANVVSGVSDTLDNPSVGLWFNPAAFSIPTAYNWGNAGRDILFAPAIYNVDFALSRKFKIREKSNFSIRWETFNTFNTPQFAAPASTIGNVGVGAITATVRSNRQMQVALRLGW